MRFHPGWSTLYERDAAGAAVTKAVLYSNPSACEEYWVVPLGTEVAPVSAAGATKYEMRSMPGPSGPAPRDLQSLARQASRLAQRGDLDLQPGAYQLYAHRYVRTTIEVLSSASAYDPDGWSRPVEAIDDNETMKWANHGRLAHKAGIVELEKRVRGRDPATGRLTFDWLPVGWAVCRGNTELRVYGPGACCNAPRSGDATATDGPSLRLGARTSGKKLGYDDFVGEIFGAGGPPARTWQMELHRIATRVATFT